MSNAIPKMSPSYVNSMITFKDYLIRQNEQLLKPDLKDKNKVQKIIEVKAKTVKNQRTSRDSLEYKYNTFIDRIYGKICRERFALDAIMIQYANIKSGGKKRNILNRQEKAIMDEIQVITDRKVAEDKLMKTIFKEFQNEMRNDPSQVINQYKLQKRIDETVSNQIFEQMINRNTDFRMAESLRPSSSVHDLKQKTHYSNQSMGRQISQQQIQIPTSCSQSPLKIQPQPILPELSEPSFTNNFFEVLKSIHLGHGIKINTYRERLVEEFKKLPEMLVVHQENTLNTNTQQKQRIIKLKQSADSARVLLTQKKTRSKLFQNHLAHEQEYLNIPQNIMVGVNQETPTVLVQQEIAQQIEIQQQFMETQGFLQSQSILEIENPKSPIELHPLPSLTQQNMQSAGSLSPLRINLMKWSSIGNNLVSKKAIEGEMINQLNQLCNKQKSTCRTIIKHTLKQQRGFDKKYDKILGSHDKCTK